VGVSAQERLQLWGAETAVVLGSGLSVLVNTAPPERAISYSEFPDLPRPTVPGHAGRFVLSELGGTRMVYAQGRVHLYEGHTAQAVTAGIRLLAASGIKRLVLTNAAGSVNPEFGPGSWMMIRDHLNLTGTTPLLKTPTFVDLTDAYAQSLRARFTAFAKGLQMPLHEGVYAGVLGPQYETPAEVRMLRHLGADAIGMSTVLETIQARALGLEVAGFSCLTNWAAGFSENHLSHAEVLRTGEAAAHSFRRLLAATLADA
jgi:purine-nucleoside phosphorylase